MLTYVKTDLFESPAQVLVNTVNVVGVMGKGIAKQFKEIYPEMFTEYQHLCENKLLDVGNLWIYKTPNKWVLNFPTKKHWRSPSKIEYIELGLEKFVKTYAEKGITSISFPLLGCGNGGLDWENEVQPLMEEYLRPLPIDIFIHLNSKKKIKREHEDIEGTKKWLRSNPYALSFNQIWEDIGEIVSKNDKIKIGKVNYEVKVIEEPEPMLFFISKETLSIVTQEQMADVWNCIRKIGFCLKQSLPSSLFEISELLFLLLTKLSYIEPVSMAYRFKSDSDLQTGIRLVPHLMIDKEILNMEGSVNELET